jgi:maleylacetoacetate isomerase
MQIKFYFAVGANCCDRVRWALDYKGIAYAAVDLDQAHDSAHFARISPFGRVPIMEIDGVPLSESMAMVELLEEIFPSPALTYSSPLARAQVREVCEAVNASIHPVQNSSVVRFFQPEWSKQQMQPVRAAWIRSNLTKLQSKLFLQSGFAVGVQFTLADIFIAAIFAKGLALGIPASTLPAYEQHWRWLMNDRAIRDSCPINMQDRFE